MALTEKLKRWRCPLLQDQRAWLWLSPSPSQCWPSSRRPRTQSPGLVRLVPDPCTPTDPVAPTVVGQEPKGGNRKSKAVLISRNGAKLHKSWYSRPQRGELFNIGVPRPLWLLRWGQRSKVGTVRHMTSSYRRLAPGLVVRHPAAALVGPSGACSAGTLTETAAG